MIFKVYRIFSRDDELLYVGMSCRVPQRMSGHRKKKWWRKTHRVERSVCDDWQHAVRTEKQAIWDENPKHNICGKRGGNRPYIAPTHPKRV